METGNDVKSNNDKVRGDEVGFLDTHTLVMDHRGFTDGAGTVKKVRCYLILRKTETDSLTETTVPPSVEIFFYSPTLLPATFSRSIKIWGNAKVPLTIST